MQADQLTATTNSGTQTTTQDPQIASGTASGGTQSSSVQPGTAASVLTGSQGVTLHSTALTTVNLQATTPIQQVIPPKPVQPASHHFNPVILSFGAMLCLAAIVMFVMISRSAKNQTKYS